MTPPSILHRSDRSTPVTGLEKWELIALLWFAFFLNQGDRQIYNVVLRTDMNREVLSIRCTKHG